MRFEGRLKSWNDERGFGFIEPRDGGQDIFVHASALPTRFGRPQPGQSLSFQVELNRDGKKRATNVGVGVGDDEQRRQPARRLRQARAARWSVADALAVPVFLAVYVAVALAWGVAAWVALAYLGLSVVCLFAYAFDKSAARAGARRTSEKRLLLLGLAGGWPGALVAQQLLRHKSGKASFRSAFPGTVFLNAATFVIVHSPWLSRWQA